MTRFLLLALLIPLSACMFSGSPADELYVLKAGSYPASGKAVPVSLRIAEPDAAPGLDTERIAVMESPNHMTYYTGAAWAQPLPQMLQHFLLDAFQKSHAFKSVSNEEEGIASDVILLTSITDYNVDRNAAGETVVHLRLVAKLMSAGSHKGIAAFTVEKTGIARANHMADIVAAFNQSMDEAVTDILKELRSAYGKRS